MTFTQRSQPPAAPLVPNEPRSHVGEPLTSLAMTRVRDVATNEERDVHLVDARELLANGGYELVED